MGPACSAAPVVVHIPARPLAGPGTYESSSDRSRSAGLIVRMLNPCRFSSSISSTSFPRSTSRPSSSSESSRSHPPPRSGGLFVRDYGDFTTGADNRAEFLANVWGTTVQSDHCRPHVAGLRVAACLPCPLGRHPDRRRANYKKSANGSIQIAYVITVWIRAPGSWLGPHLIHQQISGREY